MFIPPPMLVNEVTLMDVQFEKLDRTKSWAQVWRAGKLIAVVVVFAGELVIATE